MVLSTFLCRAAVAAVSASYCVTGGLAFQLSGDAVQLSGRRWLNDIAFSQLDEADRKIGLPPLPYNASAPTNLSEALTSLNETVDWVVEVVGRVNDTLNTKLMDKFYKATTALNGILVAMQTTVDTLANASTKMNKSNLTEPYLTGANDTIASLNASLADANETLPASFKNLSAGLSVAVEAVQNQTDQISALLAAVQAAADIAESISNITRGASSRKAAEQLKQDLVDPQHSCEQASAQLAAVAEKIPVYIENFTTLNETIMTAITTYTETANTTLATMNASITDGLESGTIPDSLVPELVSAQMIVGALQDAIGSVATVLFTKVLPNVTAVAIPLLESTPDYVEWAQQLIDVACAFPMIGNTSGGSYLGSE